MTKARFCRWLTALAIGTVVVGGCGTSDPTAASGAATSMASASADVSEESATGFAGRWTLDAALTEEATARFMDGDVTSALDIHDDGTFEWTFAAGSSSGAESGTWAPRKDASPQPGAGGSATLLTASGEPFLAMLTEDENGLVFLRSGEDMVLVFVRE